MPASSLPSPSTCGTSNGSKCAACSPARSARYPAGMLSGAAAAPVFAGRIGVEDLRTLLRREVHQQPVGLAGHRIVLVQIEIGKQRGHEETEAIGSGETRVEISATCRARDIGNHAVEGAPVPFVD